MKHFKIEFKETYMTKSVVRECEVSDLDEAIKIYGLNEPDIEYWNILEEQDIERK